MEQHREPRNKLHIKGQLIFDKRAKNIQWEMTVSSTTGSGKTG